MTVLESLKGLTSYPVPLSFLEEVAVRRYLIVSEEISADVLESKGYALAKADIYAWLVLAPSISQGGISFSLTDAQRELYKTMADGIYSEYGLPSFSAVSYGYKGTKL